MKRKKSKLWSWSTGDRGKNRVRVCERRMGGAICLEVYEPSESGRRPAVSRNSLRHTDREAAKAKAMDVARALLASCRPTFRHVTLGELFEIYEREVTPSKATSTQYHDRHAMALFLAAFGAHRPVHSLNRRDWDFFVRGRRDGTIVPGAKPVRGRVIEQDLKLLLAILNWATRAGDERRGLLLDKNPLSGLPVPREENPNRPMMSADEYARLLRAAGEANPLFACFLVLAHETGHRSRAIRYLKWNDVRWDEREILWRAESDKVKNEHVTPLSDEALAALQRARYINGQIGDGWVFPNKSGAEGPVPRERLKEWWLAAEIAAGLPHVRGKGFHSLRRKFATEYRNLPMKDLQQLGGWKDHNTILKCYQQPDMAAMRDGLSRRLRLVG